MKKYFYLFITGYLIIYSPLLFSQQSQRKIDQQSFKTGERLTFSIGWEFISAGTAVLSVEKLENYQSRPCYTFSAITHSNRFFSKLYKVRDTLISIADAEELFPYYYSKAANEGDYQRYFTVRFDHQAKKAYISDRDSGHAIIAIPDRVQDILSCFYYMRTQDVRVGQTYSISVFDNGKVRPVPIEVLRREKMEVEAGAFDCIVVRTTIGPFSNRSDLFIWLTDDERKMPVLMKSKIVIGSVRAELVEYRN